MHVFIDRRLNPSGKSAGNRQKLLKRARESIGKAVRESSGKRDVSDILTGGAVSISLDGIAEPTLHRGRDGVHDHILPGNDKFSRGDVIPRPRKGGGGSGGDGGGSGASPDGEGDDVFRFVLSREEYIDLFMSDLELPDMVKRKAIDVKRLGIRRAGYSVTGSPANISIPRTCRMALSRRMALGRPSLTKLEALTAQLDRGDITEEEMEAARIAYEVALAKAKRVPYIDPIDVHAVTAAALNPITGNPYKPPGSL